MENESIRKVEFDAAYAVHKESVYQVAMLYLRNQHTAEDITQEVFLRYYIYTEHNKVKSVKGWLLRVTKNLASNYRRDHRRETPMDLEETGMTTGVDRSAESVFFKKLWKRESLGVSGAILDALNKKNVRWYRAVTLVYCMEYSYEEAAECMEITVDALDSILRRAKSWIKENYKEEYGRVLQI